MVAAANSRLSRTKTNKWVVTSAGMDVPELSTPLADAAGSPAPSAARLRDVDDEETTDWDDKACPRPAWACCRAAVRACGVRRRGRVRGLRAGWDTGPSGSTNNSRGNQIGCREGEHRAGRVAAAAGALAVFLSILRRAGACGARVRFC